MKMQEVSNLADYVGYGYACIAYNLSLDNRRYSSVPGVLTTIDDNRPYIRLAAFDQLYSAIGVRGLIFIP